MQFQQTVREAYVHSYTQADKSFTPLHMQRAVFNSNPDKHENSFIHAHPEDERRKGDKASHGMTFFLNPSLLYSWIFEHDCLDTCCFGCLICMCFIFLCLCLFIVIKLVSHETVLNTMIMIIIIIITIIIIIQFKGAIQDFLQSPHSAVNCLQHARSSGPGTSVCKSRATYRALITCK